MKSIISKISVGFLLFCYCPNAVAAVELLSESFSDCGDPSPAGWEVKRLEGNCEWIFNSNRENQAVDEEGCYAMASSEICGDNTGMETVLVTPLINCFAASGTKLSFAYHARLEHSSASATVQISVNGGTDWVTIWERTESDFGPATATVDISEEADGQPAVLIRFHYHTDVWDWSWQVDDVKVTSNKVTNLSWLMFLLGSKSGSQSP